MNSAWRREGSGRFVPLLSLVEVPVPSVIGLLEAREKKVREEVTRLRKDAERVPAALDAAGLDQRRRPAHLP
ncbi:hypothetical protein [Streptomyces sp. TE5632]